MCLLFSIFHFPFSIRQLLPIWLAAGALLPLPSRSADLPNILWLVAEDINPNLGCYGDRYADTPNLDRFAARSLRYTTCWSTAPVCAPARTALISGVYPSSTGAEHMRSMVNIPEFMRLYPQLLRERGYYCVNNAKTDYNFQGTGKIWDASSKTAHYKNRKPGQPFFAAFNMEITHESQIRNRPHTLKHDPAKAPLPAYHPDTPEVRRDWAQYYDRITEMDAIFARHLKELEDAGLAEDTIVFFYGDNGSGMPRSKRWPYNSGLHVPLIIHVPDKLKHLAPKDYKPGGVTDRLVAFVDFAPTLLSIAGVKAPDWMQGHAFLGQFDTPPQNYLHGLRGRMDERYDLIRSVRNQRYIYIRNYMPHLIYGQYLNYMFQTPTTRVWKQLYDEGKLKPPQTFFWEPKPAEELYDLQTDKDEVKNLAYTAEHQAILNDLRQAQRDHLLKIRDTGLLTEAEQQRRAAGTTRYEMGHNNAKYPLERILTMAEAASSKKALVVKVIKDGLKDEDCAVRYWAVMALLIRKEPSLGFGRTELQAALADESPSVRIAAARALGQYGNTDDLQLALPVLKQLASPPQNGPFASLEALTAIDDLGPKAAPLFDTLKTTPKTDPKAPARSGEYTARMLDHIMQSKSN